MKPSRNLRVPTCGPSAMAGDRWTETTLGAIADKGGYGLVDGPFGSNLPASAYTDAGVPVIRGSNLSLGNSRFEDSEFVFVSEQAAERLSRSLCRAGDIVFTKKGTLGQTGLVPVHPVFEKFLLSSNQMKLTVDRQVADPLFVYYYVSSPSTREKIVRDSEMTGVPKTNVAYLRGFPIHLPSLHEQRAIACILGALDDKIELNRRMNRTLEGLARALFQSWFVDFDPVRAKAAGQPPPGLAPHLAALFPDGFENSELGEIPKGWTIRRLEELTTHIGSGATPRGGSSVYVDHGVALVRSQNVYDYEFHWDGLVRITPDAAKALEGVTLEANDVLFNITGASILRTCVVDPAVLPARVNQHVARIRAKPPVSARFLHLHLVRQEMKERLIGFNAGATREAVTKGHLQAIRLVTPPDKLLRAFDVITGPIYSRTQANLQQTRSLTATRDALLPKLISGELRVPDAERIVGRCAS